jgi:hypothetical protein
MALFGNVDADYTKTGKGFFTKAANFLSYIPGVGGAWHFAVGMVDTVIEAGQWLFRGKFGSAATALVAGTVGNGVNAITGTVISPWMWWGLNAGSGVATGETLGTHARALTENIIAGISRPLGGTPTVLSSYPAGPVFIGAAAPTGIGKANGFVGAEASRRGESADAAWRRMQSNQAEHLAALDASRARAATQQMGV